MKLEDIHIGDVLQVRDWDDMALEFGVSYGAYSFTGYIPTKPVRFVYNMKYLCGKVFTVQNIRGDGRIFSVEGYELSSCPENPGRNWIIVASMLRPFIPDVPEDDFEPVDLSEFMM